MLAILRTLTGYILAILLTYLIGAIFVSQGNLAQVAALGVPVNFTVRLDAALHDIANMLDLYLPLIGIALLIALAVARAVIGFLPHLRLVGYMLAGFVGLIALHVILEAVLGLSGIAPTRFIGGLLLQGVAGAIGGLVFHLTTQKMGSE